MRMDTMRSLTVAAIGLAMAGAASGAWASEARCPVADLRAGLPPGPPPRVMLAKTVSPSDTSTSKVIKPDPAVQIECGKIPVKTIDGVVFSRPKLADGREKPLALDLLIPAQAGRRPLVIYITGGGFMISPRKSALDLRTYVAEAGFVVASIEYRTVPGGASWRDGVSDVKAAIRYLREHADEYGVDPDHIAVWGESAGGYLAAMAGVTGGEIGFDVGDNLDQDSRVQAVVDKFGAADVTRLASDFDPETQAASSSPANPIFRYISPAEAPAAANPVSHVDAKDPPFLLFHGSQDTLISPSQTLAVHQALRQAGVDSTRYVLVGAGHGDLGFLGDPQAGLPWSSKEAMDDIVTFLKRVLG